MSYLNYLGAETAGCVAFTTVQNERQDCCLKNSGHGAATTNTAYALTSGYMNCFNELWTAHAGGK